MNTTLAVLGLSGGELMVVLVVILVLFGAKKIPEFAKGLGKGISEFKKASSEVTSEIQQAIDQPVPPSKPAPSAPQNTTASANQPPAVTKI
jgi:sec-independent protein translocase protein TatA